MLLRERTFCWKLVISFISDLYVPVRIKILVFKFVVTSSFDKLIGYSAPFRVSCFFATIKILYNLENIEGPQPG